MPYFNYISLLSSHLHLGLQIISFPCRLPIKILCTFFMFPVFTCSMLCLFRQTSYDQTFCSRGLICCHVFMAPWLRIMGFGLHEWTYWRLLVQSLLITIITRAQNQWLPESRSILPGLWTVFSSSVSSTVTHLAESYEWLSSWFSFLLRLFWNMTDLRTYSDLRQNWCLVLLSTPTAPVLSIESESCVTTDGQSAGLSWNKAPIWSLRPYFYYCHIFAGLLMWGALSDERTGQSFTIAPGPRQRSHSRIRVHGTQDRILLSQIRVFLFIAFYDSQGNGGGIRPRLHTGYLIILID
jgi:hypothetical protein